MIGSVEQEFRQRLAAFVGGAPLAELVGWWLAHLQALADSPLEATRQLEGELALLHAEWSVGDRSEAEIRALLAAALSQAEEAARGTEPYNEPTRPGKRQAVEHVSR